MSSDINKILKECSIIAIVGLSDKEERDSHKVAKYLQEHGYRIIPVNPKQQEILGEKCYGSLKDIPEKIDIVDVFRKSEAIPAIAQETMQLSSAPKCFWMQKGVEHSEAAQQLKDSGIVVVENICIKIAHSQI